MASRMIHYTVAKEILKQIPIDDKNAFCIGAIIADAWSLGNDENKRRSHFYKTYLKEDIRGYAFDEFAQKYLKDSWDAFCLGYFVHLIMDTICLKDIIASKIYRNTNTDRKELVKQLHKEMHMFNHLLVEKYHLKDDFIPLSSWKVEEVDIRLQEVFLKEMSHDFKDEGGVDYMLTTPELWFSYMDKCIDVCIRNLCLVMNGKPCEDVRPYFLSNQYC